MANEESIIIDLTADSDDEDVNVPRRLYFWPQDAVVAVIKLVMSTVDTSQPQEFVWIRKDGRECKITAVRQQEPNVAVRHQIEYSIQWKGGAQEGHNLDVELSQQQVGMAASQSIASVAPAPQSSPQSSSPQSSSRQLRSQTHQQSSQSSAGGAGAGATGGAAGSSQPSSSWSQESVTSSMILSNPSEDREMAASQSIASVAPAPQNPSEDGEMEEICTPAVRRTRKAPERWSPDADFAAPQRRRSRTADNEQVVVSSSQSTAPGSSADVALPKPNRFPIRQWDAIAQAVEESGMDLSVPEQSALVSAWCEQFMLPVGLRGADGGTTHGVSGDASGAGGAGGVGDSVTTRVTWQTVLLTSSIMATRHSAHLWRYRVQMGIASCRLIDSGHAPMSRVASLLRVPLKTCRYETMLGRLVLAFGAHFAALIATCADMYSLEQFYEFGLAVGLQSHQDVLSVSNGVNLQGFQQAVQTAVEAKLGEGSGVLACHLLCHAPLLRVLCTVQASPVDLLNVLRTFRLRYSPSKPCNSPPVKLSFDSVRKCCCLQLGEGVSLTAPGYCVPQRNVELDAIPEGVELFMGPQWVNGVHAGCGVFLRLPPATTVVADTVLCFVHGTVEVTADQHCWDVWGGLPRCPSGWVLRPSRDASLHNPAAMINGSPCGGNVALETIATGEGLCATITTCVDLVSAAPDEHTLVPLLMSYGDCAFGCCRPTCGQGSCRTAPAQPLVCAHPSCGTKVLSSYKLDAVEGRLPTVLCPTHSTAEDVGGGEPALWDLVSSKWVTQEMLMVYGKTPAETPLVHLFATRVLDEASFQAPFLLPCCHGLEEPDCKVRMKVQQGSKGYFYPAEAWLARSIQPLFIEQRLWHQDSVFCFRFGSKAITVGSIDHAVHGILSTTVDQVGTALLADGDVYKDSVQDGLGQIVLLTEDDEHTAARTAVRQLCERGVVDPLLMEDCSQCVSLVGRNVVTAASRGGCMAKVAGDRRFTKFAIFCGAIPSNEQKYLVLPNFAPNGAVVQLKTGSCIFGECCTNIAMTNHQAMESDSSFYTCSMFACADRDRDRDRDSAAQTNLGPTKTLNPLQAVARECREEVAVVDADGYLVLPTKREAEDILTVWLVDPAPRVPNEHGFYGFGGMYATPLYEEHAPQNSDELHFLEPFLGEELGYTAYYDEVPAMVFAMVVTGRARARYWTADNFAHNQCHQPNAKLPNVVFFLPRYVSVWQDSVLDNFKSFAAIYSQAVLVPSLQEIVFYASKCAYMTVFRDRFKIPVLPFHTLGGSVGDKDADACLARLPCNTDDLVSKRDGSCEGRDVVVGSRLAEENLADGILWQRYCRCLVRKGGEIRVVVIGGHIVHMWRCAHSTLIHGSNNESLCVSVVDEDVKQFVLGTVMPALGEGNALPIILRVDVGVHRNCAAQAKFFVNEVERVGSAACLGFCYAGDQTAVIQASIVALEEGLRSSDFTVEAEV